MRQENWGAGMGMGGVGCYYLTLLSGNTFPIQINPNVLMQTRASNAPIQLLKLKIYSLPSLPGKQRMFFPRKMHTNKTSKLREEVLT